MLKRFLFLPLLLNIEALLGGNAPEKASSFTQEAQKRILQELPFNNTESFKNALKNQIAPLPNKPLLNEKGMVAWDPQKYSFITLEATSPDTVNPSLWRQSQLVNIGGLFKVVDRIYQVRNNDLSNITFIEGDTGIIVADPLISQETAQAALELYFAHRPKKPIVAVIYSHSHVDHYGGVKGVITEEDVTNGRVKVIAPLGFLEAATVENLMAGNAMSRRASYMYGNLLPANPQGQVGAGLGMTTSEGTITLIAPTDVISSKKSSMVIDGLTFEFLLAPDSEAPAEMHWYIKELKALTVAENSCHTMHNTYSLRGAKIRNPLLWSKYLNQSLVKWGEEAEVLYGMHHWPVWGNAEVQEHLSKQRDLYRYINDQTLRLANHGYTMTEIAEMVELPPSLALFWSNRGYYGALNHNVKATYVLYLGWFDGNPAHLHPLPPQEASLRYVEYMGGSDAILEKAEKSYEAGDYRWVAEVVNHVVFADPKNQKARDLQAKTLEQMGYQAESGPWRNFYLTGAQELRVGVKEIPSANTVSLDMVKAISVDDFFDYLAIRLNGPKAAKEKMRLNFTFSDTGEQYFVLLENGVLNHTKNFVGKNPDASFTLKKSTLDAILLKQLSFEEAMSQNSISVTGNKDLLSQLLLLLDDFNFWFNIITPQKLTP